MTIEIIRLEPGRTVLCDWCNEDYTDKPDQGGMLFQSKATCPKCKEALMPKIKEYGEEYLIRMYCPPLLSFADWIRLHREPTDRRPIAD
jgi:hypothetical protein